MKRFSAAGVSVDIANQQCSCADPPMEFTQNLERLGNETGFKNQVLRRVPGQGQLRCEHQLGAVSGQPLVSVENFLKIAAEIANGRVDLGKADLHSCQIS